MVVPEDFYWCEIDPSGGAATIWLCCWQYQWFSQPWTQGYFMLAHKSDWRSGGESFRARWIWDDLRMSGCVVLTRPASCTPIYSNNLPCTVMFFLFGESCSIVAAWIKQMLLEVPWNSTPVICFYSKIRKPCEVIGSTHGAFAQVAIPWPRWETAVIPCSAWYCAETVFWCFLKHCQELM